MNIPYGVLLPTIEFSITKWVTLNQRYRNHDLISISEFQIPGVGGVKDTHDKNDEVMKCERSEHVKDSEMPKGTIVSLENPKGKTLKSHQPSISVGYVNRPITSEIL
jgi:hypothetical protein